MSLGPRPPFEWSLSRQRTLEACARRYYWDVYGAWGGWEREAPEEKRIAYRLKKLRSLDLALGTALHRRAWELAELARAGRAPPSEATLRRRTRDEVGRLYRASREAFVRDPKGSPMLQGFYYGEGPDEDAVERVREKLRVCLPHLLEVDLWPAIRERRRQVVFAADPDRFYEPVVREDGTRVHATPDLVLWSPEEETYTVVDWKTGKPRPDDRRQIEVYGLFAHERYDVPRCRGRIVYLLDGSSRREELGPEAFEETRARIARGIEAMREYVEDPERNDPKPRSAFPLARDRWECRWCRFFELCEEELRDTGPLPWEESYGPR